MISPTCVSRHLSCVVNTEPRLVEKELEAASGSLGRQLALGRSFHSINGKQHYLWRAVDQDGDVIDILQWPENSSMIHLALA